MNIVPEKFAEGDQVRVIAPSLSAKVISEENWKLATQKIASLQLTVTFGKHLFEADAMSSTSIEARIADLHDAFSDKKVKGILAVIGGFNANQLLQYIDYDLIRNNPKIFCGFSDITVLLNSIYRKTGLVTYYGPHFSTFAMQKGLEYTLQAFKKTFFENKKGACLPSTHWSDDAWYLDQEKRTFYDNEGYWVIREGVAKGHVIGGHLSTFQLLHGTPYLPSLENSILFVEADSISEGAVDVVEFDRDLQSLIHQPGFEKVRGLVIGRFEKKFKMDYDTLSGIINSKKELRNIPVLANADFGHTMPICILPIGETVEVKALSGNTSIIF